MHREFAPLFSLISRLLLLLSAGLGSCVVYRPMQVAIPNIRARGEGEVAFSSYLNGRFEGSASYSPASHLLLYAAGSFSPKIIQTNDTGATSERQYNVGIGRYWTVGPKVVFGGLLGFGQGLSQARFRSGPLLGTALPYDYTLRFNKIMGEVHGLFQFVPRFSLGIGFRVSQVNFTTLTNYGQPVDLTGMLRLEPGYRLRLGVGPLVEGVPPAEVQLALGLSFIPSDIRCQTYRPEVEDNILQPRIYATVGIVVFPHRLWSRN